LCDGPGSNAATDRFFSNFDGQVQLQFEGGAASTLSHRYLWANPTDQLLADEVVSSNNTLWTLTDHLGTIRDVADQDETTNTTTVVNHRLFNAFGSLTSQTNSNYNVLFAYTGRMRDDVAQLQNNLNRWYDAVLGQWLSEDPIGFEAGDANIRRYVGNEVLRLVDPNGLDAIPTPVYVPMTADEFRDAVAKLLPGQTMRAAMELQFADGTIQKTPASASFVQFAKQDIDNYLDGVKESLADLAQKKIDTFIGRQPPSHPISELLSPQYLRPDALQPFDPLREIQNGATSKYDVPLPPGQPGLRIRVSPVIPLDYTRTILRQRLQWKKDERGESLLPGVRLNIGIER
jgi:RHS repeat-associated protein